MPGRAQPAGPSASVRAIVRRSPPTLEQPLTDKSSHRPFASRADRRFSFRCLPLCLACDRCVTWLWRSAVCCSGQRFRRMLEERHRDVVCHGGMVRPRRACADRTTGSRSSCCSKSETRLTAISLTLPSIQPTLRESARLLAVVPSMGNRPAVARGPRVCGWCEALFAAVTRSEQQSDRAIA